jgi:Uma2 family endonuclease
MEDAAESRRMTVDDYVRLEETSPIRHEYVSGEVYAMSGATARHNRIAGNIFAHVLSVARRVPCDAFMSDMRLEAASDRYYYPDVMVVCTPVGDSDVVARAPCVVLEVTSPSTARIDRGEKLDAYRQLATLRAYLIVDHRRRRVERHWRDAAGKWQREDLVTEGRVPVPCLDVELTLDEIYERVELPAVGEPESFGYEVGEDDPDADE